MAVTVINKLIHCVCYLRTSIYIYISPIHFNQLSLSIFRNYEAICIEGALTYTLAAHLKAELSVVLGHSLVTGLR